MNYYIRKTDTKTGSVLYRKCMTLDGFVRDKSLCWQFSKQGALKIIERYKQQYRKQLDHITFDLEEVQE